MTTTSEAHSEACVFSLTHVPSCITLTNNILYGYNNSLAMAAWGGTNVIENNVMLNSKSAITAYSPTISGFPSGVGGFDCYTYGGGASNLTWSNNLDMFSGQIVTISDAINPAPNTPGNGGTGCLIQSHNDTGRGSSRWRCRRSTTVRSCRTPATAGRRS